MRMKTWWTLLALGGSALYVGNRVFVRFWDFGTASNELSEATRRYRADGLPFVAADVAPPALPAGENAADVIRAAGAMVHPFKRINVEAILALSPSQADATVAPYAPALAKLQAAVSRRRVDFGRDWDLGWHVLFPEYQDMKALARAATIRAVRSAEKGDDVSALRDLSLACQLGFWAGQEPTLISLLVRLAIENVALDGAERCVTVVAKDAVRVKRYEDWLRGMTPLPRFGDALRGEMFMGVAIARNFEAFGGIKALTGASEGSIVGVDPKALRRNGLPEELKARAFLARHLQIWDEVYRTTDGLRKSPEAIGATLDGISARIEREKGLSYVYSRILMPVFSSAGAAITTNEARRAVDRAFAEAVAFHAKRGVWPTRVSETDPFTGAPLRLRVGKEFRVYSVGRDRKDDGGLSKRELRGSGRGGEDVVAAFPKITMSSAS